MGYQEVKTKINNVVRTNGNQGITGANMNEVLNDMLDYSQQGGGVSVSQNTLTIGGEEKGELAGQLIDNPEWVQVVTDSQDKVLYGVKTDGKFYFGDGCPPQVQEYVSAQLEELGGDFTTLLNGKVDKITGKSLIDSEFASSQSVITNPEWIDVKTDSEDKILEGIKSDGTKEINLPTVINSDLQVLGSLDISGATYSLCQSPEWIKVLVDSQERIIAGVRTDGSVYINKIEGVTDAIQEIRKALGVLEENVSELEDMVTDLENNTTIQVIKPSYTTSVGYITAITLYLSNESAPYYNTSPIEVKKGDVIIIDGGRVAWCTDEFSIITKSNVSGDIISCLLKGDVNKQKFTYTVEEDGYIKSCYIQYNNPATKFSITITRIPGNDALVPEKNKINIVCDGDSLTWGALYDGSQSPTNYPKVLQDSLGDYYKVFNFGVPGAQSAQIVGNACGFRVLTSSNISAVARYTNEIEISMFRDISNLSTNAHYGVPYYNTPNGEQITGGANPCYLNGIEFNAVEFSDLVTTNFRRKNNGTFSQASVGDVVITNELANFKGCTHIINIGTNRGFLKVGDNDINSSDNIAELKAQYDCIINVSDDLYIVISPHGFLGTGNVGAWNGETIFDAAYGSHYINSRKYFSEDGISDAIARGYLPDDGTYPTAQDTEDMNNGKCPTSLLEADGVHLSSVGYHLLGDLVAVTYKELLKDKVSENN